MAKTREWIHEELEALRQIRDEVRVQAKLGQAELRDHFQELEHRFHELEGKARQLGEGAREDLSGVGEAARRLATELREGYRKLRARL